jgi:hypothetical protein
MLFNKDFAIQNSFQKILHNLHVRKFGSLSAVRTTCHTVRMPDKPSIICPDDVHSRLDLHCFEKLLFQVASVRMFQQHVRTPLSDRSASDSFQVQLRDDCFNRSDDVDSLPDALIHKARIAIQISPFGRAFKS